MALGMALSKYSLALPAFIFLLFKHKYKIIISSLLIQIIALLAISIFTHVSPVQIMSAYLKILRLHLDLPGIHIARLFSSNIVGMIISVIFTILVLSLLTVWYIKDIYLSKSYHLLTDVLLFSTLCIWSLLAAYHRAYDTILAAPFITLCIYVLKNPHLSPYFEKKLLSLFLIVFVIILIMPASGITFITDAIDENFWLSVQSTSTTIALLIALLISLLWLYKLQKHLQIKAGVE